MPESQEFLIDAVTDQRFSGDQEQVVALGAYAAGFHGGSSTVRVRGVNELTIQPAVAQIRETALPNSTAVAIRRNGDLTSPLTVTLSANDLREA